MPKEYDLAGIISRDATVSMGHKRAMSLTTRSVTSYIESVRGIGSLEKIVMGASSVERTGFLWNVYPGEVTTAVTDRQAFNGVCRAVSEFEDNMSPLLPFEVYDLSVRDLPSVIESCREQNIDISVINLLPIAR